MSKESGNSHQGIFMENGSGGVMSDLIFDGVSNVADLLPFGTIGFFG
jgi:hypothetical protein